MKKSKKLRGEIEGMGFVLHRADRHLVFRHPAGGPQLVVSATASDARAQANALADARRIVRSFA